MRSLAVVVAVLALACAKPATQTVETPPGVDIPAAIPRAKLVTPAFEIDDMRSSLLDSTTIGGMPNPDGSANVSRTFRGGLYFVIRAGPDPVSFAAVELFARSVEIPSQDLGPRNPCGGNTLYDNWTPGPAIPRLELGPARVGAGDWDLEVPANTALTVMHAGGVEQFPSGFFTVIVKLSERGGGVHWVETQSAIQAETSTCAAP